MRRLKGGAKEMINSRIRCGEDGHGEGCGEDTDRHGHRHEHEHRHRHGHEHTHLVCGGSGETNGDGGKRRGCVGVGDRVGLLGVGGRKTLDGFGNRHGFPHRLSLSPHINKPMRLQHPHPIRSKLVHLSMLGHPHSRNRSILHPQYPKNVRRVPTGSTDHKATAFIPYYGVWVMGKRWRRHER